MAARASLPYSAVDIARQVQDLVLECADLPGFLADLTTFCSDELSRVSGDVACGMTVHRQSCAPVTGGSEKRARLMEEAQTVYREGPGWAAILDAAMVLVADLRSEERWPSFIEAARAEKVLSVLALPLQVDGSASAGMSFYSTRPHGFGRDGIATAQALAADASRGLRLVLRIAALQETQENLRSAMAARSPVDLAVGVIIGQERCGHDVAVEWLFRAARSRGMQVRDLAREVINSAGDAHPLNIHFDG